MLALLLSPYSVVISLMLRRTPLSPKRAHGRYIALKPDLLSTIRPRRQFDQRMQRHLHPRTLLLRHIHVVRVYTPQHRLVRHDDNVFTSLQFHDDGLETDHDVPVGFPAPVAVVVFVVVPGPEVFGVAVCDFLVGEAVANAGVKFVERFPFQLVIAFWGGGEEAGCLDCAF